MTSGPCSFIGIYKCCLYLCRINSFSLPIGISLKNSFVFPFLGKKAKRGLIVFANTYTDTDSESWWLNKMGLSILFVLLKFVSLLGKQSIDGPVVFSSLYAQHFRAFNDWKNLLRVSNLSVFKCIIVFCLICLFMPPRLYFKKSTLPPGQRIDSLP